MIIFAVALFLRAKISRLPTVFASISHGSVVAQFNPVSAFGYTIDGHEEGNTNQIFTSRNISLMKSCGAHCLSYRLRTELACEAWHWNPKGTWSDPKHRQGYWTSSDALGKPIETSYGYFLPRRGNSIDQADNSGYSRLDDGNPNFFWKSNPYLSRHYTHKSDSVNPQWVVIDLGKGRPINELKILWGNPYALKFQVQYWTGRNNPDAYKGSWSYFLKTSSVAGHYGLQTIRLLHGRDYVRWIRIVLLKSSHTPCDPANSHFDIRDCEGFAIRELYCGHVTKGRFHDAMVHGTQHQTTIVVSSTDPWHQSSDLDRDTEQPGIDRVLDSGLAKSRPILVPVPALYGCPQDSANLIRYLLSKRVKIKGVEIGEEPDGQLIDPRDYAELYYQFAKAIKNVDREIPCGGPSLQSTQYDYNVFPHLNSRPRWATLFVHELKEIDGLKFFNFFSFEWYPYDNIAHKRQKHLLDQTALLTRICKELHAQEIARRIPWYITEFGFSAYGGQPEVTLSGAVMDSEIVADGLMNHIQSLYLYGAEPSNLMDETNSDSYGDNMILLGDDDLQAIAKLAPYYAEQMITKDWTNKSETRVLLLKTKLINNQKDFVKAYCIKTKSGMRSWLILNCSRKNTIPFQLQDASKVLVAYRFGPDQYQWKADRDHGYPKISKPPLKSFQRGNHLFQLPPLSITVIHSQ